MDWINFAAAGAAIVAACGYNQHGWTQDYAAKTVFGKTRPVQQQLVDSRHVSYRLSNDPSINAAYEPPVEAPTVSGPPVAGPTVTAPTVSAPAVNVSNVDVPATRVPAASAASTPQPRFVAPRYANVSTSVPSVKTVQMTRFEQPAELASLAQDALTDTLDDAGQEQPAELSAVPQDADVSVGALDALDLSEGEGAFPATENESVGLSDFAAAESEGVESSPQPQGLEPGLLKNVGYPTRPQGKAITAPTPINTPMTIPKDEKAPNDGGVLNPAALENHNRAMAIRSRCFVGSAVHGPVMPEDMGGVPTYAPFNYAVVAPAPTCAPSNYPVGSAPTYVAPVAPAPTYAPFNNVAAPAPPPALPNCAYPAVPARDPASIPPQLPPRECAPIVPQVNCFTSAAQPSACSSVSCGPTMGVMDPPTMPLRHNMAAWGADQGAEEYVVCESESCVLDDPCAAASCAMSGLIGEVDYLGWQAERIDASSAVFAPNGNPYDAPTISPVGSGMRARLGYRALSGWDVIWNYTYFEADGTETAFPVEGPTDPFPYARGPIDANADVQLNLHALELGRWNWSGMGSLRPFVGFQWTQLKETATSPVSASNANAGSWAQSNLDAYGLRIGVEWKRPLFGNFQAYAKAAGSIAVGELDAVTERFENGAWYVAQNYSKTHASPSVEAALGLAWNMGNFQARGGYEFNDWFNAARLGDKTTDFIAHGWFAGLSWNR